MMASALWSEAIQMAPEQPTSDEDDDGDDDAENGQGYTIVVTEFQNRGLPHAHISNHGQTCRVFVVDQDPRIQAEKEAARPRSRRGQ